MASPLFPSHNSMSKAPEMYYIYLLRWQRSPLCFYAKRTELIWCISLELKDLSCGRTSRLGPKL